MEKTVQTTAPRSAAPPEASAAEVFLEVGDGWHSQASERFPNALTCDVEDYFQVSAFEHLVSKESWSSRQCRIERNVDRILAIYDEQAVKGTFFTLSWVAENYPDVVKRISEAGHEIASHGIRHERIFSMSEAQFREEVSKSKRILEDVSGQTVTGFRAASWSFDARTPWAHRVLAECGYRYSSSIYPIAHDHYGVPDAPATPFFVGETGILEIPATVVNAWGRNWPAAGGGYFRLYPYSLSRYLFDRARSGTGMPSVFYYHPWELDAEQPRMSGIPMKTRVRHYLNLAKFEARLVRMLKDFDWDRMDNIYLRPDI